MVGENPESKEGLRILARIIARVRLAEMTGSPAAWKRHARKRNEGVSRTKRDSINDIEENTIG